MLDYLVGLGYGLNDLLEASAGEVFSLLGSAIRREAMRRIEHEMDKIQAMQYGSKSDAAAANKRLVQLAKERERLWRK